MKTFFASFVRLMGAIQTGIGVFHLRIAIGLIPPMAIAVVASAALYWDAFVPYKSRALWHEVARGYLEGAALLALEDSGSVMARLGNHVCARDLVVPIEHQLERLRAVTIEDVDRVAAEVLGATPAVVGVGPLREDDLVG